MRLGRLTIIVVVAGLLTAGTLADINRSPDTPPPGPAEEAAQMPTAAPATALSSTWYCVGATGTAGGTSAATVVIANPGGEGLDGGVTVVSVQGRHRSVPVRLPPRSVTEVPLTELARGTAVAAVVDLQAGQAAAELVVGGTGDGEVIPCASAASERWHFADGSTARDASLSLSLFNPFPEDAIADLSFSTDQGRAEPADLQGVVVPSRSLVVKEIGEHVRRRESVASVVSVRSGRLVATQGQGRTAPGRAGVSVTLGAPSPGRLWYFPDGMVSASVVERFSLANPGPREAQALLEVSLDQGVAEPFEITVPPWDRVTITFNEESRIPKGVGHATTVRSLNGVPVVATRIVESAGPQGGGRADVMGARRSATQWLFVAGGVGQGLDEWIVVQNPGDEPAVVSLVGLTGGAEVPLERAQEVTVEPGRRRAFRVGESLRRSPLPLMVRSRSPVVAERTIYAGGRPGLSVVMGIPLR